VILSALPLLISLAFLAGRAWGWSVERGLRDELDWKNRRIESVDQVVAMKDRWRDVALRRAARSVRRAARMAR
jgi:hypothetical protein